MRFLDLVRQCNICLAKSLEENQKLTQMGRLTSSIRFVDVSEKECQVSIDEYYTVMVIKRDTTPPIQINLNDIKSAKILPKTHLNRTYPIGFRIVVNDEFDETSFEFLLPEDSGTKQDQLWIKSLQIMFALIFEKPNNEQ